MPLTFDQASSDLHQAICTLLEQKGLWEPQPRSLLDRARSLLGEGKVRSGLEALSRAMDSMDLIRPRSPELESRLRQVVAAWYAAAALYTMRKGILAVSVSETEFGGLQCVAALRFTERAGLKPLTLGRRGISLEEDPAGAREALEEFHTLMRLLSIEDPAEGWRALAKEVTKRWPKGLSVEDAMREERGGYDA